MTDVERGFILATAIAASACANSSSGASCWQGRDAGPCTDDSQCPKGNYCDFSTVTTCVWDGGVLPEDAGGLLGWGPFGRAAGGVCVPDCRSDQCQTADDCEELMGCFGDGKAEGPQCTAEAPCPHGGLCAILGTPAPPNCPLDAGCKAEAAPHLRGVSYCDCPAITCVDP